MNRFCITFIIIASQLFFAQCTSKENPKTGKVQQQFTLPEIPSTIQSKEARIEYLAENYWDNFNFSDTSLISKPDITEKAFAEYLNVLHQVPNEKIKPSINKLLDQAYAGDSLMFSYFTKLSERYLYDPNSPLRDENLYIPVLEYIIESTKLDEITKIRPRDQLKMALKNRPGNIATDFAYVLANGEKGRLSTIKSTYTILFFNNPGCHDCKRVKKYMEFESKIIAEMQKNKEELTVLALYPDTDVTLWKKETYPAQWINARDASDIIKEKDLYDLKAIPTLYLLDKDKKVILKDAPIETIDQWLNNRISGSTR